MFTIGLLPLSLEFVNAFIEILFLTKFFDIHLRKYLNNRQYIFNMYSKACHSFHFVFKLIAVHGNIKQ